MNLDEYMVHYVCLKRIQANINNYKLYSICKLRYKIYKAIFCYNCLRPISLSKLKLWYHLN